MMMMMIVKGNRLWSFAIVMMTPTAFFEDPSNIKYQ